MSRRDLFFSSNKPDLSSTALRAVLNTCYSKNRSEEHRVEFQIIFCETYPSCRYSSHLTSYKLPDFATALESYIATPTQPSTSTEQNLVSTFSPDTSQSRVFSGHQLRYTAYEVPRPTSRLNAGQSAKRRSESSVSDAGSSRMSVDSYPSDDHLSRTMTAGELALAARDRELEKISKVDITCNG